VNGAQLLGSRIGVVGKTVGRWLSGEMQCSNEKAWDLIKLAVELIPDEYKEILYEDVSRYFAEVDRALIDRGGGTVIPHRFKAERMGSG
jgi:hypothetical protein